MPLVATVFPAKPIKKTSDAESFGLTPTTAPGLTAAQKALYAILDKNLIFRIQAPGYKLIARASPDGIGNLPFQYIGDENGSQEVVQGYYTVDANDCGISGTLTFHFHKPTGNYILADYQFYGNSDGSKLWFSHVEMGTNVTGEAEVLL